MCGVPWDGWVLTWGQQCGLQSLQWAPEERRAVSYEQINALTGFVQLERQEDTQTRAPPQAAVSHNSTVSVEGLRLFRPCEENYTKYSWQGKDLSQCQNKNNYWASFTDFYQQLLVYNIIFSICSCIDWLGLSNVSLLEVQGPST